MSQPVPSRQPSPPALYSWSEVWTAVVTKPSVNTFVEILRDPAATSRRAYIWLFITGCISALVFVMTLLNDPLLQEMMPYDMSTAEFNALIVNSLACAVPLAGALSIGVFMVFVAAIHFIAERLNPEKPKQPRYPLLVYALAAVIAPLNILSILLLILSVSAGAVIALLLAVVNFALLVYQLVLMGTGVRAVYGLNAPKAALALGVPFATLVILYLGYLTMMGL